MRVTYSLNTEKEIIWSLPYDKASVVTSSEPTKTVETDLMTNIQKKALAIGIRSQKLFSDTNPNEIFDLDQERQAFLEKVSKAAEAQAIQREISTNRAAAMTANAQEQSQELSLKAREILKGSIASVKKEIAMTSNLRFLRILDALEQGTKKRISIIKTIANKLNSAEAQVAHSIADDSDPIKLQQGSGIRYRGQMITYDDAVVESEMETITIKFGYDEESESNGVIEITQE